MAKYIVENSSSFSLSIFFSSLCVACQKKSGFYAYGGNVRVVRQMVDFQRQLTFKTSNVRPGVRSGVRPGVRPGIRPDVAVTSDSGRTVVCGARVVSGAEKSII